ncbi:hypothetical protein AX15_003192 [Amanita polypyramis BW_CC]|nr:hypothetical protein AX15_003192 [Amanita polypyramis BW_CC]
MWEYSYYDARVHRRNLLLASKKSKAKRLALVFPIHRLPREILAEIFIKCLPDAKLETLWTSKSFAPILLCNICSSWRELAVATPHLWSTLGISIRDSALDKLTAVHVTNKWLERSGTLPLTLRLKHNPFVPFLNPRPVLVKAILSVFANHASRWEDVALYLEGCPRLALPQVGSLPLLRAFHLQASKQHIIRLPFSENPRLVRLSWPYPFTTPTSAQIPWHQMTHLRIETGVSMFSVSETIRLCPSLEELDVDITLCNVSTIMLDGWLPRRPILKHAHLQRLAMVVHEDCSSLLDSLILPVLTELLLDNHFDYAYQGRLIVVPSVHSALLDLLTRSECSLDKLGLLDSGFSAPAFLRCLEHKSLETLRALRIEDVYNQPMFTDDVLVRLTDFPSAAAAPVLLPKLTHLVLEMCLASSPGILGKMVYSRRCAWDEDEEGQLESFSLVEYEIHGEDRLYIRRAVANGLDATTTVEKYPIDEFA